MIFVYFVSMMMLIEQVALNERAMIGHLETKVLSLICLQVLPFVSDTPIR